jgi:hypothetical protein
MHAAQWPNLVYIIGGQERQPGDEWDKPAANSAPHYDKNGTCGDECGDEGDQPAGDQPRPKDRRQRDDEQVEDRWVIGCIERINGIVPIGPLAMAVEDGIVQLETLPLIVVEGPLKEVRSVGDVHAQITDIGQDGKGNQDCAE